VSMRAPYPGGAPRIAAIGGARRGDCGMIGGADP
jgi:hypothetical protein